MLVYTKFKMEAIKTPVETSPVAVEQVEQVNSRQNYYQANRDKILQRQREYYQANKTRYADIYADKKAQRAEYAKQYRLANKERLNQIQREYRQRKKQASIESVPSESN